MSGVDRVRMIAGAGLRLTAADDLGYAFTAAPIPMAVTSPGGRFRLVNAAYEEMAGRSEAELRMLTVADITHPDDVAAVLSAAQRLRDGESTTASTESRLVRPDRTTVWALTTAGPIPGEDTVAALLLQTHDLSEVKAREADLVVDAERLRLVADGAEGFLVYRTTFVPELRAVYISSGVEQMLGYTVAEWMCRPSLIFERLHPDDHHLLAKGLEGPLTVPQMRWLHRDGSLRWSYGRTVPIVDAHGQVVGVDGLAHDITARVRAEQALQASEQRFRSLVQNSTDLLSVIGPDGKALYVSPSVGATLGHADEHLLGDATPDLSHAEDSAEIHRIVGSLGPGEQAAVEFRAWHADGTLRWLSGTASNQTHDPAVGGYVLNTRDVTEQHRLREELAHRANFDQLTGLPTKLHFRDLIAASLTESDHPAPVAIASVDADGMAPIAEAFGDDHADSLLVQVVRRLTDRLPAGATLARLSGERLGIAVPATGDNPAATLARTVLAAFEDPFPVGDDGFQLDATVGVAISGEHGDDAALLLRRAEVARRGARAADRRYHRYSPDMDEHTADRLSLLGRLRDAIGSDQLRLHYQPKLHLASGAISGVEALIRWHHPDIGMVAPDRFIGLAERSGLIAPLTRWVIGEAARQSRAWRDAGIALPIAVNITPRSLQDPAFAGEVLELLRPWRLPAQALCLELTERAVSTDPVLAIQACRRLTDEHISLSLDDFGTGQSSLGQLASLPISELKIDMSFVRPLTTSPIAVGIARMIIDLAHELSQTTTAEGVEDGATMELLRGLGCDTIQGYHLCRPLPADDLTHWLAGRGKGSVGR
jgi:PAS domain S-box-containing protein/diguanylate cyclase (GGDEF)-like protein